MFYISGSTDVGIKRNINQDSLLVQKINSSIGEIVFACICDGMGGLQNGELASATVVHRFKKWVSESLPLLTNRVIERKDIVFSWQHIIDDCNANIMQYGQHNNITLGTTLTAILFTETEYFAVNIGDTRAYEIGAKLKQITCDHTVVQNEIDCGRMTLDEAKVSRRKNVLTKCIGVEKKAIPDYFFGKVRKNTTYLICSDGFRHKISEHEMLSVFKAKNTYHHLI